MLKLGSVVRTSNNDNLGIIRNICNNSKIEVDIFYKNDNYLIEPYHITTNNDNLALADNNDFRVGYLNYLSRREYLHVYSTRDKERISAILYQVKKAWETYPDLRLGQLLIGCCGNDAVMFGIEDELLMERLQKELLDEKQSDFK